MLREHFVLITFNEYLVKSKFMYKKRYIYENVWFYTGFLILLILYYNSRYDSIEQ